MLKRVIFWFTLWFLLFINLYTGFAQSQAVECQKCGPHILGCFDLRVDVTKPKGEKEINNWKQLYYGSQGYIDWLLNTQPRSLYPLLYDRMATEGTANPCDNPSYYIPGSSRNTSYDYVFRGDIGGSEGNYRANLYFCTAKSNRVVAQSSSSFERASEAKEIGTILIPIMCGSGRSFPQLVGEFEVKRREESVKVARKPRLEILDYQSTMAVKTSQRLQFRLIDCDGYPLKNRKAQLHTNIGRLQADEVTFNAEGLASVNYTAPPTKGNAEIDINFDFEYPSERTGREYGTAYITITDPKNAKCALWHVDLTINRSVKTGASANENTIFAANEQIFDQLNPLQLAFDINPKLEVVPDSLTAKYNWTYDQENVWDGKMTLHCWGTDSGDALNHWRIAAKRYFKPIPGEVKLDVYDLDDNEREIAQLMGNASPALQPENTFKLEWDLVLPGRIKRIDYLGNNGVKENFEMLPSFTDKLVIDYHYQDAVHQETGKNMPVITEQFTPQVVTVEQYTVSYKLALNPITFEIVPGGLAGGSPFLNYTMTPKVNNEDCSSHFKTILFWRDWDAPVNPGVLGTPRTAAYQGGGVWQSATVPTGNVPLDFGALLPDKAIPTEKWATIHLREYLVAVDQFPEFGFYYIFVAVTNAPYRCRIQGWEAHRIGSGDWQEIKRLNHPYLNETSGGSKIDLRLPANSIKNLLK